MARYALTLGYCISRLQREEEPSLTVGLLPRSAISLNIRAQLRQIGSINFQQRLQQHIRAVRDVLRS